VALFGMAMLVGFIFLELDFDTAFLLAVLAGVLYSIYLLMSKSAFSDGRTLS
jgi:drug/metabolite transporter (DMT)-like permease